MVPANRPNNSLFLKLLISATVMAMVTASALGVMAFNLTRSDTPSDGATPVLGATEEIDDSDVQVNTIYENIYINDIHVGGLTKQEALNKLEETFLNNNDNLIQVLHESETFNYPFRDFYNNSVFEQKVEEAYNYARTGNDSERSEKIAHLLENPLKLTVEDFYNRNLVQEEMALLSDKIDVEPVNATIDRVNGNFVITEESVGSKLNVEETTDRVMQQLATNTSGTVEAKTELAFPTVLADELKHAQSLIGTFSTTITGSMELGRNINVANAASKINNVRVESGEIFSTNYHFGPSTRENGYRPAAVIVNGEFVDQYGGGVCQISSTLYKAVLFAELEVVERVNHSLRVGYVGPGFDATLAGDYIDFKFRNNTPYPIFIESYIRNNTTVIVNIFGYEEHPPERTVRFEYTLTETVRPEDPVVIEDPSLSEGQRVVTKQARNGERYQVHKYVYNAGELIERVLINNSYYRPVRGEVKVGIGTSQEAPPVEVEPNIVEQENNNASVDQVETNDNISDTTETIEVIEQEVEEIVPETVPESVANEIEGNTTDDTSVIVEESELPVMP